MNRKIVGITLCILLVATLFPVARLVVAGDEENPEIEDEAGDVLLGYIDVLSAWLYEKSDDPDYLYASLKIADYKEVWFTVYAIHWKHEGIRYWDTALHVGSLRDFPNEKNLHWSYGWYFRVMGMPGRSMDTDISGSINREKGIITWRIPKSEIGDLQPGDVLTQLHVFTAQRFGGSLIPFGPLFRGFCDTTNPLESKEYIIQY
jgi:hypothetical protein